MTGPPIHVVIISWQGQAQNAQKIAHALEGQDCAISVVYSNAAGAPESGPGYWLQVPQSWYYGRKFAHALTCLQPEEVMLQIQADAAYDNWPGLLNDCRASFARHGLMGIWAAELDWTPWPTPRVKNAPPLDSGLQPVAQSDGIVWALHPQIWQRMSQFNYDVANLGWGIDWIAGLFARRQGRHCVRDPRHVVHHPPGRGYSGAVATQHMKNLLAQLPAMDRADILALHHTLHAESGHEKTPATETLSPPPIISGMIPTMLRSASASTPKATPFVRASVYDGHVYVATHDPVADMVLGCGDWQVGFEKMDAAPPIHISPVTVPLRTAAVANVQLQENGLEEWQVTGWPTLRVISTPDQGATPIPVGQPVQLEACPDRMVVQVALARHRAEGLIQARLTDAQTGTERVVPVPFQSGFEGGAYPVGYQMAHLNLGVLKTATSLQLELVHQSTDSGATEPPIFFVARPVITVAQTGTPLSSHVIPLGTATENTWYKAVLDPAIRHSTAPLTLEGGGMDYVLLDGHSAELNCTQDWGDAFEFKSSAALAAVVYINGVPAFETTMNAGTTYLHLPAPQLTGRHAWMEIRDPSGSRVHWANWILPRWQATPAEVLQAEGKGPYPAELFHQSPYRFQALRQQIADGVSSKVLAQLPAAITALEAGHDRLKMTPLAFPKVKAPDVSIVIPAHNKVKVTYACLASLLLAPNQASFEVILVDDASTDATAEIEELVTGITVVRNAESQRFIRACNAGVAASKGSYVVLLNNDTEVTPGWLDALVDAFGRFDNVGLVGSKLLYPDGKLQDAGGVIWGTGDPWNYGNGQNAWDPRYAYARQADYLSGAAMMTTRKIWDDLEGLSSYLEPMYFEDTDFAFKVREAGYTTWFVPSSIVYHYEGMTSGTDTSKGFKRFQEVNRPKFKRRWARDFAKFTKKASMDQVDLEKDRGIVGRVLFIDYTTPTPDMDAGSYAALQEIKLVQSLGYKVTFLPENLAYFAGYTQELNKMGVEVIHAPFYTSLDQFLQARGREFDAFYITRYHVANANVPRIRAVNPDARIIMNNADLHYLRMLRKAVAENDEAQKEDARAVQTEEFRAMQSVDLVLSYNDKEHAIIEAQSEGEIKVMQCPWVLECPDSVPPLEGRAGISFLGGFRHHPNVEGVQWFAQNVMSRLETEHPEIVLSIYGSRMGDEVKKLASPVIEPIGFVADISDAYDRHRVFVAPLLSGAGIKGKVLSALAHGIPCVLSPMAAEGIGLRHGQDCMIADTPSEWSEAIAALYGNDALWEEMSQAGRKLATVQFSFDHGRNQMRKAFEAVELFAHFK
ncbi:glycosyltransferase [uncultured Tateyamaria sp.]|uniref:glycosyltransferase n=1 Tax=uncultured Tateyamaria sp. TaxID=455651 RepID=UPI0026121D43|nr:glycosyltransferase [uncultured Tateyamaria sp.]